jgi:tryptophan halogenase
MNKDIVVVGGGSAGWISALFINKLYPNLNVTVIESKEIGILGAGEGSTLALPSLFEYLGIPFSDLVKNCEATVKNGIKFTNWDNNNGFYYHPFGVIDQNLSHASVITSNYIHTLPLLLSSIAVNKSCKEVDFIEKVSEKNKVPFIFQFKNETNPISGYRKLANIAIHFNASKLANRLKEIGVGRGIKVIEKTILNVSLDKDDNVQHFVLDDGEKVLCDFVFDCSGFHRLVIGKVFNSQWKSYKNHLPVDSAVPFFINMDESIPPYTEAIAMKYGWMWKIPLQSRYGCGYVYDSSLISESDAVKEIEDFLGYEPQYPRKDKGGFKFNAGCYEESWINNCVSVGLSAGFIEPLEATSLWVTIMALEKVLGSPEWILNNTKQIRQDFNKTIIDINKEIVNLIYLHYMGPRKDTPFWEKFSYENAPEQLKEKIDIWRDRLPNKYDSGNLYNYASWAIVGSGQEMINKDIVNGYVESLEEYKFGLNRYDYFVNHQDSMSIVCHDHKEFLESLK